MKIHLHQFLSRTGLFKSKKEIIDSVKNGFVTIDEQIIINPMYRFNPSKRVVKYKGNILKIVDKKYYYVINKPIGYLSTRLTSLDIYNKKKSVFDLLDIEEKIKRTLFAVGRLDEDTSGLLIITNDGKFGFKIAHPKFEIKKTYYVVLEKPITENKIKEIEQGITINVEIDGKYIKYKTKPFKIKLISERKLFITLSEGKKREVRKIFEAINNKVLKLERISINNLNLKELALKQGQYKEVSFDYLNKKIFTKKFS
ncbi:MAG: pseudouridine synthase [Candidatus Woesearchaeota archaeon]